MQRIYQRTLEGFRPSAALQPETPPSAVDYVRMIKELVTSVQTDISAVIDPQYITTQQIHNTTTICADKMSLDDLVASDCAPIAAFCTDAGKFYADLQANALQNNDTEAFVHFGRRMETARILQDVLFAKIMNLSAASRTHRLGFECK